MLIIIRRVSGASDTETEGSENLGNCERFFRAIPMLLYRLEAQFSMRFPRMHAKKPVRNYH